MKNQYFGDKRDYFKYSALEWLMRSHEQFRQLTCVWMLTPDYPNADGNKTLRVVPGHDALATFLLQSRQLGRRDVRTMERYWGGAGLNYNSYGDGSHGYFDARQRASYFDGIPATYLTDAVVLFDPDNGLAPAGGATSAHIRYEDLRSVFNRMGDGSVAVVYQHRPRIATAVFWPRVAGRLSIAMDSPVALIAEADLALLVVRKNDSLEPIVTTLRAQQRAAVEAGVRTTVLRV